MREDTGRESGLFKSVDPHVFLIDTRNKIIKWKPATYQLLSIAQYLYEPMKFEASGLLMSFVGRIKEVKKTVKKKLII